MFAEIFDRCWPLVDTDTPSTVPEERVIDLSFGTEVTLEVMMETIRSRLTDARITGLTWDHPPTEATFPSTPAAMPLIKRFQPFYPPMHPDEDDEGP